MEFKRCNVTAPSESTHILRASHEGDLKIGHLKIPCYIVNNERYISLNSINNIFGSDGGIYNNTSSAKLPRILTLNKIKPFISNDFPIRENSIIEFKRKNGSGKTITGMREEFLPLICETIMDAASAKALELNDNYIKSASILMKGLMRVGITALIDEATGFQSDREKDGLQKILDRYLQPYARDWVLTFQKNFFEKLCRVYGLKYENEKPPWIIGKIIMDIVYDRLAPGITQKLKEINPSDANYNKKVRHHQLLTEKEGYPELKAHITKLMCLMDVSESKEHFKFMLDRAMPKYSESKLPPLELYAKRTPCLW